VTSDTESLDRLKKNLIPKFMRLTDEYSVFKSLAEQYSAYRLKTYGMVSIFDA